MNKEKYTLQEVTTPALEREWLDFPKRIYKGNRNWVCPLDVDVLEVFNPSKNELFADGEAIRWVARDARGELVGRIAAFYNREKASIEEQPTGGCGFFESIDDQQVADMLFEASRMWLASRGMEAMDGPINFGQRRDWWGLLVEGYEFQPLYKNPYNPPYYKELFENYGFKNYFNQHSFIWRVNDSEANKQIFARAERLYTVPGYRVENIDMNNLEEAAESFRVIYNKAWALFSGVKPMTQEEALEIQRQIRLAAEAAADVGPEGAQVVRPHFRHHLRHHAGVPRQGRRVGHHGQVLAVPRADEESLQVDGAGVDRRFQPRDEPHDRDLRLCYAPQGAHHLPLPVRPHEGVPPLSAPGREAPFGMICCAASLSFQREISEEF